MAFKKIKSQDKTEEELRQLWRNEYCDESAPVLTTDNIHVVFREEDFDHAFFESANRIARDKSVLSLNRLSLMLWIKDTLTDPEAEMKQGWDRDKKMYVNGRRVTFVKDNYIVVIRFTGRLKARFVTAYEMHNDENIKKVKESPNWVNEGDYL